MDFELDSGQRAWRDELRAFLRENVTPELLRERAERGFKYAGGHQAGFRRKGGLPAADRRRGAERGTAGVAAGWLQRELGLAG